MACASSHGHVRRSLIKIEAVEMTPVLKGQGISVKTISVSE